jgi:hypothetical protein
MEFLCCGKIGGPTNPSHKEKATNSCYHKKPV